MIIFGELRALRCLLIAALAIVFSFDFDHMAVQAEPVNAITVEGRDIKFDGKTTIPLGFIFQTFLYPDAELKKCREEFEFCSRHLEAEDFFFARGKYAKRGALDVAADWNANTVRLNVSQSALDPASPFYSKAYLDGIVEAVEFARKRGFAVIVALFDGRNRHAPEVFLSNNPMTPLANATTLGAASVVGRTFRHDTGVMIELLNENFSPVARRQGWKLWLDGGIARRGKYAGQRFVGVNTMIKAIREQGAENIVILQGLKASFEGLPDIPKDPLNRVIYSVHPFLGNGDEKRLDWDASFGDFSDEHPVLITAWNNPTAKEWCTRLGLRKPQEFLSYLHKKGIGVIGYALDVPGRILADFRRNLDDIVSYGDKCSDKGAAGQLLHDYFMAN